jgi:hypothetical protein
VRDPIAKKKERHPNLCRSDRGKNSRVSSLAPQLNTIFARPSSRFYPEISLFWRQMSIQLEP